MFMVFCRVSSLWSMSGLSQVKTSAVNTVPGTAFQVIPGSKKQLGVHSLVVIPRKQISKSARPPGFISSNNSSLYACLMLVLYIWCGLMRSSPAPLKYIFPTLGIFYLKGLAFCFYRVFLSKNVEGVIPSYFDSPVSHNP